MLQKADVAEVLAAEGRRGQTRKFVTRGAVIAGVLLVLAGIAWVWTSWGSGTAAVYATDPAARGDIVVSLVATGTLEPTHKVSVSSLTTGTISSVDVDYNQPVLRGQALAHLDMSDLESRLRRSLAMVDVQAASRDASATALADAQAALSRAQGLKTGETVSVRDIDMATTAVQRAQANLAAAEAQLKAAEADLAGAQNDYAKGTIVSPIDGTILDVNAEVGETLGTATLTTSLFTIADDLRSLDLEADVDEADVTQVKVGDKVTFTVEAAPDRPMAGIVRQVRTGPTVIDGVTSYKAVIRVDNSALLLKPGMTATAEISTDEAKGVLTVSNAALRFTPSVTSSGGPFGAFTPRPTIETPPAGQQHVYVQQDNQLHLVNVTIGLSDGQRTQITGGSLAEGDLVVTGIKGR